MAWGPIDKRKEQGLFEYSGIDGVKDGWVAKHLENLVIVVIVVATHSFYEKSAVVIVLKIIGYLMHRHDYIGFNAIAFL